MFSSWLSLLALVISKEPVRKWIYADFTSSARSDGATFKHWVRDKVEYPDYPFARFNYQINIVSFKRIDS